MTKHLHIGVRTIATALLIIALAAFAASAKAADSDLTAKLQDAVAGLTTEQQAALLLLLESGAASGDSAATASGGTPQAMLDGFLETFRSTAMAEEADFDALMDFVSEEFENYDIGGKEDMRAELEKGHRENGAVIRAMAPDVEFDLEDAEFDIDGDTCTIYPIAINAPIGSVMLELIVKRESDGKWRIIEGYAG